MAEQQERQLPPVNSYSIAQDDYVYESVPLPTRAIEDLERNTGSGGMSSQYSQVSSGVNNGV